MNQVSPLENFDHAIRNKILNSRMAYASAVLPWTPLHVSVDITDEEKTEPHDISLFYISVWTR